jgi:hypothetical protein
VGNVTSENLVRDNLLCSDDYITDTVVMASGGGVNVRGTLIGVKTADGKGLRSLTAASDGTQSAYGILLEDVDATSADKNAAVALFGEINSGAMILGTGWTVATAKAALRTLGIYLKTITP